MKNSGRCPKCKSTEIIYVPGGKLERQQHVTMGGGIFPLRLRVGTYICRDCGFIESWVDTESDMLDLRNFRG